jgi:hypothetical protein
MCGPKTKIETEVKILCNIPNQKQIKKKQRVRLNGEFVKPF